MADREGAGAPLRLRRLPGVIDDEGIEHRHVAGQCFRPAVRRQRDGFAGEPFERPVRAHMDECVDALPPEPQIEGDIRMTGRARKIVIFRIAMIEVTSFWLDRDDDLATPDRGKTELT